MTQTNGYLGFFDGPPVEIVNSTSAVSLNQWSHVALVRNGSDLRAYLNGVGVANRTTSSDYTGDDFYIGTARDNPGVTRNYTGYISNLRVVKGSAVYTSNFTPPTAPLTAITNTSLLTCQSPSPTTDYSSNAWPITVTGAVAQNGGGPFTDSSANKGGLVWMKSRSAATDHALYDTVRGVTKDLVSNSIVAQTTQLTGLTSFNTNGFSIGALAKLNTNAALYASWTFREQPKFFDVVTYTGDGTSVRSISHNLGSTPGCIIVKRTDSTGDWSVYHRSLGVSGGYIKLNSTAAASGTAFSTPINSTVFSIESGAPASMNVNGGTYVAYLFAHDAGGFGLSGTDNVISCGIYTGNGSTTGPTITLGYEPQWLMIKRADGTGPWIIYDTVRGMPFGGTSSFLFANATDTEYLTAWGNVNTLATGFQPITTDVWVNASGGTYIYIAIRRGPMKIPTTGTSVFQPVVYTGTNVDNRLVNTTILADMILARQRNSTTVSGMVVGDRLRGNQYLLTDSTAAASTDADSMMTPTVGYGNSFSAMNGFGVGNDATSQLNASTVTNNQVVEAFQRAPGFFDVVAYTGTGVSRTINHNLGAVPQMMWIKETSGVTNWAVYSPEAGAGAYMELNSSSDPTVSATAWNSTLPTSSVFSVGASTVTNSNTDTYIAYLFGETPGVSKVSYYTGLGVGTTVSVNCGFASGPRFVLIKSLLRSTAVPWYVWDSARGIVAGNDPYLLLDSNAAEVINTDYIDSTASGFEVTTTAPASLNESYADQWVQQSTVASTLNFTDIIYANGYWVASVASDIYYSVSGYGWTVSANIATGTMNALAFGNGLYVAVGAGGRISTSPDLTTWTARTSGTADNLLGAAYAFGKYWAVGNGPTVISSTDGITWSSVTTGATNTPLNVRFVNGNLLIMGINGTMITSTDGTSFTVQNTGSATDDYRDVTFGNSLYAVVGDAGVIRTSPDLSTWTSRSAGSLGGNDINGVVWTGNRFVAVADAAETGYSTDGITWSAGAAAGTFALPCVAFGNGMVIAGNNDGDILVSNPKYIFIAIA
jgi:hypothetical protein